MKLRRNSMGDLCELPVEAVGRRCIPARDMGQTTGKLAAGTVMGSLHYDVECHREAFTM